MCPVETELFENDKRKVYLLIESLGQLTNINMSFPVTLPLSFDIYSS